MIIKFKKQFVSYEGEGPNIGLKTLFLTYENNEGSFTQSLLGTTPAVYINCDFIDSILFQFLDELSIATQKMTTIEAPMSNFVMQNFKELDKLKSFFFIRTDIPINTTNVSGVTSLLDSNVKIKIEADTSNFEERLKIANGYADFGFDVYLMPLFKEGVGELMMEHLGEVHDKVRVMPPTQFLINMQ